jgi:hypothetical protein
LFWQFLLILGLFGSFSPFLVFVGPNLTNYWSFWVIVGPFVVRIGLFGVFGSFVALFDPFESFVELYCNF